MSNTYISAHHQPQASDLPAGGIFLDLEQRNGTAQNAEHQNLDRKLKVEQDTEGITGTAETAWEKAAVETKMEMEKKMAQTKKTTAKMEKRMLEIKQTAEGARKTTAVNEKIEWESSYQNRCNTCEMDGRTILYNL
jgi:hypothetical protein